MVIIVFCTIGNQGSAKDIDFECYTNNAIYSRHKNYVPIKLCKTAGSIHLFKIKGALKFRDIKLK